MAKLITGRNLHKICAIIEDMHDFLDALKYTYQLLDYNSIYGKYAAEQMLLDKIRLDNMKFNLDMILELLRLISSK